MSTSAQPTRSRTSRLLAIATTFLVAIGGLIAAPVTAANAAPASATSATLNWGFKDSWRGYMNAFGGHEVFGGGASASPAPYNWGTATTGSYDPDTRQGSFTVPGSVNWTGWHGIDITLSGLTVNFDLAAGTGSLAQGGDVVVNFTTSGATVNETSGTVSVSGAPSTGTTALATIFGGNADYGDGMPLDPISFSLSYTVPATATTTTIGSSDDAVEAGETVTLTATVAPAAAGSVEFFNNGSPLGPPVPTAGGSADLTLALPVGSNSITATFTPTDPAAYLGSTTATPAVVTVTAPAGAIATTTTLGAPTPAAPVKLGDAVTLSATVAATDDSPNALAGTVEFFSIAAGTTDRVSLGSAPVAEGVASLPTSSLAQGGYTFVGVFTPANPAHFQASESAVTTANYNVVDIAPAAHCTVPGGVAASADPATAVWGWSSYSNSAAMSASRLASGNVTADNTAKTHTFAEGVVRATVDCVEVSFTGVAGISMHGGTNWQEIIDPKLYLSADGTGVWTAKTRSGSGGAVVESDGYITVGSFSLAEPFGPGDSVEGELPFGFANTVPRGTWNAGFVDSWENSWVWAMQPAQRAYYFRTSAASSQDGKAALPLIVDFAWPAVSTATLAVSPAAPVRLGDDVTLTATVAPPSAEGTVEFFDISAVDGETSLGTVEVEGGVATLTTNELVAGGHTFRAEYTSTNGFDDAAASTTANYGVVDPAQPAVCTPAADSSETLTGVTAKWNWNAYSSGWVKVAGGNVTLDGQTFVLANGVATVSDDCVSIAFTGTLRTEAYQGFFPPNGQWVELVNPVLTIDSDGNGAWSAGVRTGVATLNTTTSAPTVIAAIEGAAFPDFSANSVSATLSFAYAGTTATGTWSAGRDSAWSNAFVLQVPSAIRSFYYASGAGADGNKPPAPISIDWTLAAPTGTVNGQASGASVLQGQTLEFSAGPFREGEIVSMVVNSDPVTLPNVTVGFDGIAAQSWTVPTDFEAGAHTVTFSTGVGDALRSVSVPFTVEALAAPAPEAPATCTARAVTGGDMFWEFKQSFKNYIGGSIAHGTFSGGSFSAGSGAINVDAGGVGRVNFNGSITATGHGGDLNIQISNVSVQITGPNTGILFGNLTSSGSGGYVAIANLTFSSVSVSGNTLTAVGSSATLTGSGAAAFNGFYAAGTPLDAVSFSVSLGGEVPCDATTDPVVLATSGAGDGSLPALALAALALLVGFGLTRMRRREEATTIA